jgi:uncharacterized repeat protein (TIGR02059 family)
MLLTALAVVPVMAVPPSYDSVALVEIGDNTFDVLLTFNESVGWPVALTNAAGHLLVTVGPVGDQQPRLFDNVPIRIMKDMAPTMGVTVAGKLNEYDRVTVALQNNGTVEVYSLDDNGNKFHPAVADHSFDYVLPPRFLNATTNVDGDQITLWFNKEMEANPDGKQGQFKFQVNGGADQNFNAVARAGFDAPDNQKLVLTCADGAVLEHGQIINVSYTQGTVESADDGVLQTFGYAVGVVTNIVPKAANYVSSETSADGTWINLTFDQEMEDPNWVDQFQFRINDLPLAAFADPVRSGDNKTYAFTGYLELIAQTDVVNATYSGGDVRTVDGGKLTLFDNETVTVNVPESPEVVSAKTSMDGTEIIVEFDKAMGDPAGNAWQAQFDFNVNGNERIFNGIAADGNTLTLTVDGDAIESGDMDITLNYTRGTTVGDSVVSEDSGVLLTFENQAVKNVMPPEFVQIDPITPEGATTKTVVLNFSKPVWWGSPLKDTYAIRAKVNDNARVTEEIPARPYGDASPTIDVTFSGPAINWGDVVSITITDAGATEKIKETVANTTMGLSATREVRYDGPAAPLFVNATTNADGDKIIVWFNKEMADPTGKGDEFHFTKNWDFNLRPFEAARLYDGNPSRIELDIPVADGKIVYGDTIQLCYPDWEGTVTSADGAALENFWWEDVTNAVPVTLPELVDFHVVTQCGGSNVELTFNVPVWWNKTLTSTHIAAKVNGETWTIADVAPRAKGDARNSFKVLFGTPITVDGILVNITITDAGRKEIREVNEEKSMAAPETMEKEYISPPRFESVMVVDDGWGDKLNLTFNKDVWWGEDLTGDEISVMVNGVYKPILDVQNRAFEDACPWMIVGLIDVGAINTPGWIVEVAINADGAGQIKETVANVTMDSGAVQHCEHTPSAPAFVNAITTEDGSSILVTFNKPMAGPDAVWADFFKFQKNGGDDIAFDEIDATEPDNFRLICNETIVADDVVTVNFTALPGTQVTSLDGGVLASFGPEDVENTVPPRLIGIEILDPFSNVITLSFDANVWWASPLLDGELNSLKARVWNPNTWSWETRVVTVVPARAKDDASQTLDVTLSGQAFVYGNDIEITITDCGAGKIKDAVYEKQMSGEATQRIYYPYPPDDPEPPVFEDIEFVPHCGGTHIWLIFNEEVGWEELNSTHLAVTIDGEPIGFADVEPGVGSGIELVLDTPVNVDGQVVVVTISDEGANVIRDVDEDLPLDTPVPPVEKVYAAPPTFDRVIVSGAEAGEVTLFFSKNVTVNGLLTAELGATLNKANIAVSSVNQPVEGSNEIVVLIDAVITTGDKVEITITAAGAGKIRETVADVPMLAGDTQSTTYGADVPVFVDAWTCEEGDQIVIEFSKIMAVPGDQGWQNFFTFQKNGGDPIAFDEIERVDDYTYWLTCTEDIFANDIVTVTFETPEGAIPVTSLDGGVLADFGPEFVDNSVPPRLESVEIIDAEKKQVLLTFDSDVWWASQLLDSNELFAFVVPIPHKRFPQLDGLEGRDLLEAFFAIHAEEFGEIDPDDYQRVVTSVVPRAKDQADNELIVTLSGEKFDDLTVVIVGITVSGAAKIKDAVYDKPILNIDPCYWYGHEFYDGGIDIYDLPASFKERKPITFKPDCGGLHIFIRFDKDVWWDETLNGTHLQVTIDGEPVGFADVEPTGRFDWTTRMELILETPVNVDGQVVGITVTEAGADAIRTLIEGIPMVPGDSAEKIYAAPPTFDAIVVTDAETGEVTLYFSKPIYFERLGKDDIKAVVNGKDRGLEIERRNKDDAKDIIVVNLKGDMITAGQTVEITITASGAEKIYETVDGEEMLAGNTQVIYGYDPVTRPTFVAAWTDEYGEVIYVELSDNMADPGKEWRQFTFVVNGEEKQFERRAADPDGDNKKRFVLGIAEEDTIKAEDIVNLTYTPGTVAAVDGGLLAAFNEPVDNLKRPEFLGFSVEETAVDANVVKLFFDEPVFWNQMLAGGVDIKAFVAGGAREVVDVEIREESEASEFLVMIIKGAAIFEGQSVKITITKSGAEKIIFSETKSLIECTTSTQEAVYYERPYIEGMEVISHVNKQVRIFFSKEVWWMALLDTTDITVTVDGEARRVYMVEGGSGYYMDIFFDGVILLQGQEIVVTFIADEEGYVHIWEKTRGDPLAPPFVTTTVFTKTDSPVIQTVETNQYGNVVYVTFDKPLKASSCGSMSSYGFELATNEGGYWYTYEFRNAWLENNGRTLALEVDQFDYRWNEWMWVQVIKQGMDATLTYNNEWNQIIALDGGKLGSFKNHVVVNNVKADFNQIQKLNSGWTIVSTQKWIETTQSEFVNVLLAYKYDAVTGTFSSATVSDLKPVEALYVKTADGHGWIATTFTDLQPLSTKMVYTGWNLVSAGTWDTANAVLSPLRYIQVGQQEGTGLTTLVSQAALNRDTGNWYLPTLTQDDWTILGDQVMSPFDGYWIYMNGGKVFGVLPGEEDDWEQFEAPI